MSLAPGTRLAHYEILEAIGKGGMGEVYRARDGKLGRDVAIKVLPEEFAENEERLARFKREAKVLASLNHPNIASIYGLEQSDNIHYLVLELVPGETLAERISRGPIPLEEALDIATQMAEALEEAHEQRIVHRDLKPANVKQTEDGKIKVLDYGLAKVFQEEAPEADSSMSPTLTRDATRVGVILGTAAYMSPEQAEGKKVDKRTDIWSFGVVLFEMLTGKKMYSGETVPETLASVIKDEPGWSSLPSRCPGHVRALLSRCLTKDPQLRLRDIGEARIALSGTTTDSPPLETRPPAPLWQRALPWALTVAVAALAVALAVWNLRPVLSLPVTRTVVALQADEVIPRTAILPLAFSPDGSHMVYSAQKGSDPPQLYLRPMNSLEGEGLSGTEGGDSPFFSPDGRWVGFFAGGQLKKVSIAGGAAMTISSTDDSPQGASWGADDRIIFGTWAARDLLQVSADGGTSEALTSSDASAQDSFVGWPEILPESHAVLFDYGGAIMVQRLDTGERKVVVRGGTFPHYLSSGHLVYQQAATLMAVPFDVDRLEISGSPVPVLEGIRSPGIRGGAQFAVSRTGTLAYLPGFVDESASTLVWVDRLGVAEPLPAPPRQYEYPRVSPDGQRVAVALGDIWVYDVARDGLTRLTFEGTNSTAPVWSPDARRIAFFSIREGPDIFWQMADGSGGAERLTSTDYPTSPTSFSPDGQLLAFTESNPETGRDIWVLNLADRETHLFLSTRFEETAPMFSPDGEWMAYSSDESGQREVYVQPYPGPGGKWQISTNGGHEPVWNPEGGELFYRSGSSMMAVALDMESGFTAGTPQILFEGPYVPTAFSFPFYDVSADGQRFLMLAPVASQTGGATQIHVVLNWTEELKRLVPTDH